MQNPAPTNAPLDPPVGAPPDAPSRAGNLIGISACAVVLGLLIWAKLQLVTNMPRTAIADPKDTPPSGGSTTPLDHPPITSSADPRH